MNCPKCKGETMVYFTANTPEGMVRRRRRCKACQHTFVTYELTEERYNEICRTLEKEVAEVK